MWYAVADYAAQALVSTILAEHFPKIPLIGEEDAKDLNEPSQHTVRDKIVELANGAIAGDLETSEDQEVWNQLGKDARSSKQWLEAIDRGNAQYSNKGRESFTETRQRILCTEHKRLAEVWALDPIDGTKGFLRGGQYAVCLALLEDGKPVMGVMGTPNLPLDYKSRGETGVLFVTSKGKGAFQV